MGLRDFISVSGTLTTTVIIEVILVVLVVRMHFGVSTSSIFCAIQISYMYVQFYVLKVVILILLQESCVRRRSTDAGRVRASLRCAFRPTFSATATLIAS